MENQTEFIMTDETIAQIAKVLQVAILTGTDIVDNLRTVRFNVNNDICRAPAGALQISKPGMQKSLIQIYRR